MTDHEMAYRTMISRIVNSALKLSTSERMRYHVSKEFPHHRLVTNFAIESIEVYRAAVKRYEREHLDQFGRLQVHGSGNPWAVLPTDGALTQLRKPDDPDLHDFWRIHQIIRCSPEHVTTYDSSLPVELILSNALLDNPCDELLMNIAKSMRVLMLSVKDLFADRLHGAAAHRIPEIEALVNAAWARLDKEGDNATL